MNIVIWLLDRFVKLVTPYYQTPEVPQPASAADLLSYDFFSDFDLRDQKAELDFFTTLTDEGEVTTSTQWGLQLPNGEVHWGSWSGIDFSTPLDRMRMIATLQKTALDMGLSENGQSDELLNKYKWKIREATARIRYKDSGTFSLNDPAVSAAPVENSTYDQSQDDSEASIYSPRTVHAGSVGGDA